MNSNDLADRLEEFYKGTHIQKAAEELRRLQAENDALRKEAALQRMSDLTQEIDK
jgi:hypothetical protein